MCLDAAVSVTQKMPRLHLCFYILAPKRISVLFINMWMLYRAEMADQLSKVKDEVETKARQEEAQLDAKKTALLDVIKKYVLRCFFCLFTNVYTCTEENS